MILYDFETMSRSEIWHEVCDSRFVGKDITTSYYNIVFKIKDYFCVYNAKSNACLYMNEEEYMAFKVYKFGVAAIEALCDGGFYTYETVEEQIASVYEKSLFDCSKKSTPITLIVTNKCNAKCFYCFNCHLTGEEMDREIVDQTINYMVEHADPLKPWDIHWFGGEPLCGISVIDRVTSELKKYGIVFTSRITTNGSLIDDDIIRKFVEDWNVQVVHLSLDGYGMEHAIRKGFSVYYDAYTCLLNFLGKILEKLPNVKFLLRINLDLNNLHDLSKILLDLKEYMHCKNLFLQITRLRNENDTKYDGYFLTEKDLSNFYRYVFRVIKELELSLDSFVAIVPKLKKKKCFAETEKHYVVCTDGGLCKCLQQSYNGCNLVGSLNAGIDCDKESFWTRRDEIVKMCKKCKLFPLCGGGCKHKQMMYNKKGALPCANVKYYLKYFIEYIFKINYGGRR